MIFTYEGNDGFWVATAEEGAKYLGYPADRFGTGFVVGRWLGCHHKLGTFATIEEAIAAEPRVPNRTVPAVPVESVSNALGYHTHLLDSDS